jgi:polyhydroxyalkanoate synthase subunit PhaC
MSPSLIERQLLRFKNGLTFYAGLDRPAVGQTPRDLVWRRDTARLWRYRSDQRTVTPPVLIVHSLVSKSYILDLMPGNSMIGFLLGEGFDVFMLEWDAPCPADSQNTLETYVDDYIPAAIAAGCEEAGADDLTLVGYCLGGVLVLLLAAAHSEQPVRNLVTLTTPCDFTKMGFMSQLFIEGRLEPQDVIAATGLVPARTLDLGFQSLKPTDRVVQQVNVWQNLWNDQWLMGYLAMNKWARDQIAYPGAAFAQTVQTLIRDNALAEGVIPLGRGEARLADIKCPYLNVFCRRDEIVPPGSAEPLVDLVGSGDASDLCLESGHVGLVAGRKAHEVSQPQIAEWIRTHSDKPRRRRASQRTNGRKSRQPARK